jgi:hypothetical protein
LHSHKNLKDAFFYLFACHILNAFSLKLFPPLSHMHAYTKKHIKYYQHLGNEKNKLGVAG